jgi:hypothetical protein
MIPISDTAFSLVEHGLWEDALPPKYQFQKNKWWSQMLSLKGGQDFGQPCNVKVSLILQNTSDILEKTSPIRIADFVIQSRDVFLTNLIGWGITSLLALAALIVGIIALKH